MTKMIESFATMLLADAFWSTWEDDESVIDLITQEEREKFCRSYAGSGCEIVQGMECALEDLEIDIKPFLPLEVVQQIVDNVNEFWKNKYSVEELHEYCQRASHRLILGRIGHGVDADDDTHIAEMFEELGISTPPSSHEGAYEQGENLASKVEETLAVKYGHQWVKYSTSKYDILILAQKAGDGNSYFSIKAMNRSTFKSDWVTNMHSIVTVTGSSEWEKEFADWEMPFEEAIAKMQILEDKMKDSAFMEWFHKDLESDEEEFEWN
jgi:hypothetical protein